METKSKVSERAVLARLNRKLAPEWSRIKKCRADSRAYRDLGTYYVIDSYRNLITDTDIDLELWAREQGVLGGWEAIDWSE